MTKLYSWIKYPKINVGYEFDWDFNVLAKTLWYNSMADLTMDWMKTYELNKHDPFLMVDMDKLVQIVSEHIKNKSNILIFWDFDVDGITASATLYKGLIYLGVEPWNIDILLPNREVWYSIKREYILEYINNPNNNYPNLIITVDCWIKSSSDVDYIVNQLWIEVVITDHHWVDELHLPLSASAIVNPHREWWSYPFQEISGSLVALKVVEALETYLINTRNQWFITGPNNNINLVNSELRTIAMLWTVADVMPILNENKWLVKETLPTLQTSPNMWLRVMVNMLRKKFEDTTNEENNTVLTTEFIGWQVAPRINAVWRIWNPYNWLKMFLYDDKRVIENLFENLDSVNKRRQEITREEYLIASDVNKTNNQKWLVYVKDDLEDWIIWLIAWRLKEEYYKPTVVIGGQSIVCDIVTKRPFTFDEEQWIYTFINIFKNYLEKKYNNTMIYWVSIRNSNTIMFSTSEIFLQYIEKDLVEAFNNVEYIYNEWINALMEWIIRTIPQSQRQEYTDVQIKEILISENERFSKQYAKDLAKTLSNINTKDFSIHYQKVLKWSCRSIPWFHITEALENIDNEYKKINWENLLLWFWGHPMAAWFWIKEENVEIFKKYFEEYANQYVSDELLQKELNVNIEVNDISLLTPKLAQQIGNMWPFWAGNEFPNVLVKWKPIYWEIIWKTRNTFKLQIEDNRWNRLDILFFRFKDEPSIEEFCNLIVNQDKEVLNREYWFVWVLNNNNFRWNIQLQLIFMDLVI